MYTYVDLKYIIRYLSNKSTFFQYYERISIWGLLAWQATYKFLCGNKNTLIERKVSCKGCRKYRVHGLSLAESLAGKKRGLSSSSWALL